MDNNSENSISDELINSFIDQQITTEERQQLLELIQKDKNLANRVCELQNLKQMTQLSYEDIPRSRLNENIIPRYSPFPRLAAVITIFSLGLMLGLGMMQLNTIPESSHAITQNDSVTRVLLHLTSAQTDDGLNTLNDLEQMLQQYEQNQQPVYVEVIANGNGIELLSPTRVKIAQRISYLTRKYDNLNFAACKNTLDQLQLTRGIKVQLIPEVKLIDSGVVEVIKRQREGWTYIRG